MTEINLSQYAPKDLIMNFGRFRIISPVPDAQVGKKLAAMHIAIAYGVNALLEGNVDALEENVAVEGIETEDDINRLVLGTSQVDELLADGCPPALINRAGNYALVFWTQGEAAATEYIKQDAGVGNRPKANRNNNRNRNKRRKR